MSGGYPYWPVTIYRPAAVRHGQNNDMSQSIGAGDERGAQPGWSVRRALPDEPEAAAVLLLAEAERQARELGSAAIRLNTRSDLVEARALYAKHGYAEIPKFGDDRFADQWFEKKLRG
jgi:hypothetical protein